MEQYNEKYLGVLTLIDNEETHRDDCQEVIGVTAPFDDRDSPELAQQAAEQAEQYLVERFGKTEWLLPISTSVYGLKLDIVEVGKLTVDAGVGARWADVHQEVLVFRSI